VSLAVFIVVAKVRNRATVDVASYGFGLAAMGLLMMVANCFVTVFQPRFTLPMWELTIISLAILFGGIMDALFCPSCDVPLAKSHQQPKQSDHIKTS